MEKISKEEVMGIVLVNMLTMSFMFAKSTRKIGGYFYVPKIIGNEPFAVILGDTITKSQTPRTKQLIDIYNKFEKSTSSLKKISNDKLNK